MTIIKGIHNFFLDCPLLTDRRINIDYLPDNARDGVEFSIDSVPSSDTVKSHLRGSGMCQYLFVLRSAQDYGPDVWQNLDNNGFYEELAAWMRQKTRKRQLPELPAAMQPLRIEPVSTAYLFDMGAGVGKYQIQCRLDYYRKGD